MELLMLYRKMKIRNVVPIKLIKAVTLVELLVSTSLFIIILFSMFSFYSTSYKRLNKLETQLFLQQQATQIMHYLKQHIEHIYFQGMDKKSTDINLFSIDNNAVTIKAECLVFFYDVNDDGCIGDRRKKSNCSLSNRNNTTKIATELFGFKREHQEIKTIYYDRKMDNCTKNQCQQFLKSCDKGNLSKWRNLTEYRDYKVLKLAFSWVKENYVMSVLLILNKNNQSYQSQSKIYILNSLN